MRRLRLGEWLAAAGGVALILSLALATWYRPRRLPGLTGFESFTVVDLYLVVVAAAGIALALSQAMQRGPALPVGVGVLTVVLALVGLLLLSYKLVDQPGPNEFMEVAAGAWIGLAATAVVLAGAWLSLRDEHVPGERPPEDVEVRPAPRLTPDAEP
jgi:hypothetical protein